jgi:hypothetical protein
MFYSFIVLINCSVAAPCELCISVVYSYVLYYYIVLYVVLNIVCM